MGKKILSRTLFETYSALCHLHYVQHKSYIQAGIALPIPKPIFNPANASAINQYLGFPKKFGAMTPRFNELEKMGYIRKIKPKEFSKGINGYNRSEGHPSISSIINSTRWYLPIKGEPIRIWSEDVLGINPLNEKEIESLREKLKTIAKEEPNKFKSPFNTTNDFSVLGKDNQFLKKVFDKDGLFSRFLLNANNVIQKTESNVSMMIDCFHNDIWSDGFEKIEKYYIQSAINPTLAKYETFFDDNMMSNDSEKYSPQELLLFWIIYSNKFPKLLAQKYSKKDFRLKKLEEEDWFNRSYSWDLFTRYILKMVRDNRKKSDVIDVIRGLTLINIILKSELEIFTEREKAFLNIFSVINRMIFILELWQNSKGEPRLTYLKDVLYFYHNYEYKNPDF